MIKKIDREQVQKNLDAVLKETDIMREINKWEWIFSGLKNSKSKQLKAFEKEIDRFLPERGEYNETCEFMNLIKTKPTHREVHDEWYYSSDDKKKLSVNVAVIVKYANEKGECGCLNLKRVGTARTLTIAYGTYSELCKSIDGKARIEGRTSAEPFDATRKLQINANGFCSFTDFENAEKLGFMIEKTEKNEGKIKKVTKLEFDGKKKAQKSNIRVR